MENISNIFIQKILDERNNSAKIIQNFWISKIKINQLLKYNIKLIYLLKKLNLLNIL